MDDLIVLSEQSPMGFANPEETSSIVPLCIAMIFAGSLAQVVRQTRSIWP
jgi:hypothetical protein